MSRHNLDCSTMRCAYATLIMKGNDYVPGAEVLAWSLRCVTKLDVLVMVTPDVSEESREELRAFFDKVIPVPELTLECKPLATQKQQEIYGSWIQSSFTKFNALDLTDYDKVLFVDADAVVVGALDHLFQLELPCAVLYNMWLDRVQPSARTRFRNDVYSSVREYGTVTREMSVKGLARGFVVSCHLIMFLPEQGRRAQVMAELKQQQPFGYPTCVSGSEEQAISLYYEWSKLGKRYNVMPWHLAQDYPELRAQPPYVLHFANVDKPWRTPRGKYPDQEIWHQFYDDALATLATPAGGSTTTECGYCRTVEGAFGVSPLQSHPLVRSGRIECPRLWLSRRGTQLPRLPPVNESIPGETGAPRPPSSPAKTAGPRPRTATQQKRPRTEPGDKRGRTKRAEVSPYSRPAPRERQ